MNATVKKVWSICTTVLVTIVVLIAVFLMGSRLLGFRVFSILSGSMEPKYSEGDLIYVQQVDPSEVREGDDITFVLNENLLVATHRVIDINHAQKEFVTQGIANDTVDDPVHFNNLIGKPVFSIPLLGYVSNWIQTSPGMYITIALGILLVLLVFLPDLIKPRKKGEEQSAQTDAESQIAALRAELAAAKQQLEQAQAAAEE